MDSFTCVQSSERTCLFICTFVHDSLFLFVYFFLLFLYIMHLLNVILREVDFYILVTTKINRTRKMKIAIGCGQ